MHVQNEHLRQRPQVFQERSQRNALDNDGIGTEIPDDLQKARQA